MIRAVPGTLYSRFARIVLIESSYGRSMPHSTVYDASEDIRIKCGLFNLPFYSLVQFSRFTFTSAPLSLNRTRHLARSTIAGRSPCATRRAMSSSVAAALPADQSAGPVGSRQIDDVLLFPVFKTFDAANVIAKELMSNFRAVFPSCSHLEFFETNLVVRKLGVSKNADISSDQGSRRTKCNPRRTVNARVSKRYDPVAKRSTT